MHTTDAQVTTAEAATILGSSVWSVRRLVQAGALEPTMKLPGLRGAFLFSRSDVEAIASERDR